MEISGFDQKTAQADFLFIRVIASLLTFLTALSYTYEDG
jgi:hypothetical protein